MRNNFPLPKLSLITGAANGLGEHTARQILNAGGRVIAIDNDGTRLSILKSEYPHRCITVRRDLAQLDQVGELFTQLDVMTKSHGRFNFVMLNAAISATGKFNKIPVKMHEKVITLNATSPMLLASGLMRKNLMAKSSVVVFISSLSHFTGYPGAASYAASKDAIAVYAKSVRRAYARKKVHVMRVFPGPIATQMADRHSPPQAKVKNRMHPAKMATRILQAASEGHDDLYPDAISRITSVFARIFPRTMTKLIRRIIFDRLDREVY